MANVAIRETVASTENEASAIIGVVKDSLVEWRKNKPNSYHLKFTLNGKIVGYLILKEYWNLSQMFVLPAHQRSGIGRKLVQDAIHACAAKNPGGKIKLNSSSVAQGFYLAMGFKQVAEGLDLPGGCIPFEYEL